MCSPGFINYRVQTITPPSTPEPFSIDSVSGQINATVELDREEVPQYDIVIEVCHQVVTLLLQILIISLR